MKRLLMMIMTLLTVASVLGAGDNLDPLDASMAPNDVLVVEYCVNDVLPKDGTVEVVVDPVCEDFNGISGCQPLDGDDTATAEFAATPLGDITLVSGAGCTDIQLTTTNADGRYYYTVNGEVGEAKVTSETGSVVVPEMGVLGAIVVLAGAGLFIARKRD